MSASPRSKWTWLAIGVAVGITAPYVVMLVETIRCAVDPSAVSRETLRELSTLGFFFSPEEYRNVMGILSGFMGVITFVVLIVIVGLAGLRQWAREAAFAVFGTMGLITGFAAVGSAFADPVPKGVWISLATVLCCGAIVGLLMLPRVSVDFEKAEMARQPRPEPERT
jgi:hypothetical protein